MVLLWLNSAQIPCHPESSKESKYRENHRNRTHGHWFNYYTVEIYGERVRLHLK